MALLTQAVLDAPEDEVDLSVPLIEQDLAEVGRAVPFDMLGLHPAVVESCRQLYLDGHPREVLERATRALLDAIKAKATSLDDGDVLINRVFGDSPVLRVNAMANETERSEQRGLMFLGKAIVALLRNPNAHELRTHDDAAVREGLAVVSLFYRYLDRTAK